MINNSIQKALNILLTTIGLSVIFLTVYIFGWGILEMPFLGNEFTFVISMTDWINHWLFQGIQWYPIHGAGGIITQATHIGVYYWIAFLHRLSGLTIGQSLRIVAFAIIFLTSVEIYFFVWWKFKSQIMAIIAGLFFPLSEATWYQISYVGILGQPSSWIFILPTIFSFDYYLQNNRPRNLALASICFGLTLFFHLLTAQMMAIILFFWAIIFGIKNIKLAMTSYFKTIILGTLLISFWVFPYLRYIQIVARNLIPFYAIEQIPYVTLPRMMGLGDIWGGESSGNVVFAPIVLIFAVIGMIIGLIKKDRIISIFSLITISFMVASGLPFYAPSLVKILLMNVFSSMYERLFIVPAVLLPILAAFGIQRLVTSILPLPYNRLKNIAIGILSIIITCAGLLFIEQKTPSSPICYRGYGPLVGTSIDYCNLMSKLSKFNFNLGNDDINGGSKIKYILQTTGVGSQNRLEVSPLNGGLVMAWPIFSSASTVNLQLNTASLNNIFWGYQVGSFYGRHEFGSPAEIASLASWFGIEDIVLGKSEPVEKYTDEYWQDLGGSEDFIIKKFKGPAGMVTLTSKPRILVMGKFANRAYEQFFRLANAGAYPYGKAMFIEGRDDGRIDGYTLDELKQFDLIFLYGYSYNNWQKSEPENAEDRQKAFKLLEDYVKAGGRVFIETGWQYASAEWQWERTANILPVDKLSWYEFKDWDLEGFSAPSYKGAPWGVSAGQGIKSWAQPVLSSAGKTLVAKGNYGQGKVVWSGLNLAGHAFTYRNEVEFVFLRGLLDWLIEDLGGEDKTDKVNFQRINPDKIEFTFSLPQEKVSLYWRENFHPDWKAYIQRSDGGEKRTEKLPIYRAGPNFILIPLAKIGSGEKVVLEFTKSPVFILARILSILTLLFLLILFFKGDLLFIIKEKVTALIRRRLLSMTKSWWNKNEEA